MATNETDSIFLIDSQETAFMLGISSRTLANWRCKGRGLRTFAWARSAPL